MIPSREFVGHGASLHRLGWGMGNMVRLISIPVLFWLALWFSINSGPWVLVNQPSSAIGWAHLVRTLLPFLGLYLFILLLATKRPLLRNDLPLALKFWAIYGTICLISSLLSPFPGQAAYWALMYLAPIVAIKLYINKFGSIQSMAMLNYISWFVAASFFLILLIVARNELLVGAGLQLSGYGIVNRMPEVGDMAMSRASGIARFASILAIVSFVLFVGIQSKMRGVWLLINLLCGMIIYSMQSRGALFSYLASLMFVMMFYGRNTRIWAILLLLFASVVVTLGALSDETASQIQKHLTRGQSFSEMESMTGRDYVWHLAWKEIEQSPLFGHGFQADRFLIPLKRNHVHNTYMYTLICGGFLGAIFFVLGLIWSWLNYFRLWFMHDKTIALIGQKNVYVTVGALLVFFTLRGIPEVSGGMFGVDLMVMLPAIAYIGILHRHIHSIGLPHEKGGQKHP